MSPQDESTPTDPTDLNLPIDYLFMIDPLDLTEEDLTSLARYYRAERLDFLKREEKPKQARTSRGPTASPEKTAKAFDDILGRMVGSIERSSDANDD